MAEFTGRHLAGPRREILEPWRNKKTTDTSRIYIVGTLYISCIIYISLQHDVE